MLLPLPSRLPPPEIESPATQATGSPRGFSRGAGPPVASRPPSGRPPPSRRPQPSRSPNVKSPTARGVGRGGFDDFSVAIACGEGPIGIQLDGEHVVTDVLANGPADKILRPGDQILSVDGQQLGPRQALHEVLRRAPAAPTRALRVRRHSTRNQRSQWL